MLFNSWQYAVFLPLVAAAYFLVPHRVRWVLLLGASYYFYMSWNPNLVFLILFTTATSYTAALGVERSRSEQARRAWLAGGVCLSLACLFFFKYFNFFSESVTALLRAVSLPVSDFTLNIILPVGISFYTFQTLSYAIDVYRGQMKAERHFGIYALYVSFFPQLVAGPSSAPSRCCRSSARSTAPTRRPFPTAATRSRGGCSRRWSWPTPPPSTWTRSTATSVCARRWDTSSPRSCSRFRCTVISRAIPTSRSAARAFCASG